MIIREIQKHPVAFKNVATLMEVMNYLTDVSALQAAGADYSGYTGKDSPTPQDFLNFLLSNRSLLSDFFNWIFQLNYLFILRIQNFHRMQ